MTKKITNKEKVVNLLKSGRACKASTIAKRLYGNFDATTYSRVRATISNLGREGYDINLVDVATYKMKK